jgi:hypothetical protein
LTDTGADTDADADADTGADAGADTDADTDADTEIAGRGSPACRSGCQSASGTPETFWNA